MSKLSSQSMQQSAPEDVLLQKQEADRLGMSNQEQSSSWKPLLSSAPILFMQIRNGKCRWPIGDPHLFESFRFCGCVCSSEAIYCEEHRKMAFAPNRARTFVPGKAFPSSTTKVF